MKRIASEISWRPNSLTFADLNESPAMSPIANPDTTAHIPHTSSCNTLQIPTKVVNDETDLGTSEADREHFADVKNSFRPGGSSHAPLVTSYHSNNASHKTSLTSATSALLHKMLRIEIRDDQQSHHQPNSLLADDSLILRSPRILITRAYSEEDNHIAEETPSAEVKQSVSYTFPSPDKTTTTVAITDAISDDEDTADDYSRLLAAISHSQSASNSTTVSTVSVFRPYCSLDETPNHTDDPVSGRGLGETPDDQQFLLSSWPPAATTKVPRSHSNSTIVRAADDQTSNPWGDLRQSGSTEAVVEDRNISTTFQEQRHLTDIVL